MIRSTTLLLTTVASALLLAGCSGDIHTDTDHGRGELKSLARLDCPEREDNLDRVSASPDGRTCEYAGDGAQVRLHLVALNGRAPAEVLAPYESELRALIPARLSAARPPMAALDTESSVVAGVENNEDKAHVRLPGLSIDAAGDRAQVRIGGAITIDADETDSVVKIRSNDGDGDVTVNADQSGAEVRASSGRDGDVRTTFMLATDATRPGDYQLVGYEARGPAAGPVLVATIRSRSEHNDDAMDAMKDLVRKTIGS